MTANDRKDAWIVVPAYNESGRIAATLRGLCSRYEHIIVVDDGSGDDTYDVARQWPVWCLRHPINCGQGAALQTGIRFALEHGAEWIVTFDADGQHSPEEIDALLEPVVAGRVDVALGSRFLGDAVGIPWSRKWLLQAGVLFTRIVSRVAVTDTHNGLRAFSRHAAARIRILEDRMGHASEILHQLRTLQLSYCEVPVTIRYDAATLAKGQSNMNAVSIAVQFLLGRIAR